jgi:hypothetical protein
MRTDISSLLDNRDLNQDTRQRHEFNTGWALCVVAIGLGCWGLIGLPAAGQTLRVISVHLNDSQLPQQVEFFCTQKYDRPACVNDTLALRRALALYSLQRLGAWSFVLVPADDWRTLVRSLGGAPESPAFSILDDRVTVLDQSLFGGSEKRNAELLHSFGVIGPLLLNMVVTHELGHGLCAEKDEHRANDYGRVLRSGKPVQCSKAPQHAAVGTSRRYEEWLDSVSRSRASRANFHKHRHYAH